MTASNTPDYSNHAFDPSEIGNTIHQHKMLQNQVRPEAASNTPFEDGLEGFGWAEEDDGSYVYGIDDHWKLDASTAELLNEQIKSLLKLHKAAIVAELEQFSRAKCICNETDTLMCDSYWHHSNAVEDRIEQYKKEGK